MRPDCKLSMGLRTVLCPTCHGTRVSGAQGPKRDDYVYLIEEWLTLANCLHLHLHLHLHLRPSVRAGQPANSLRDPLSLFGPPQNLNGSAKVCIIGGCSCSHEPLSMHLRKIFDYTDHGAANPTFQPSFLRSRRTFRAHFQVIRGIRDDLARQCCTR